MSRMIIYLANSLTICVFPIPSMPWTLIMLISGFNIYFTSFENSNFRPRNGVYDTVMFVDTLG